MTMNLTNLDAVTRVHMRREIEGDIARGELYLSPRLSPTGLADYPDLLLAAADGGTTETFAAELAAFGRINAREMSHSKTGKVFDKAVPYDANETLAEGELNRFYARGLCARVVGAGGGQVEVYRAKAVAKPRAESEAMIGQRLDAAALLTDLRTNIGVEPALGLPPGPNSGLSVQLPTP